MVLVHGCGVYRRSDRDCGDAMNKLLQLFRRPGPLVVASRELVEAQLSKLSADSAAEWAQASSKYNADRIARLTKYINTLTKDAS